MDHHGLVQDKVAVLFFFIITEAKKQHTLVSLVICEHLHKINKYAGEPAVYLLAN